jgi:alkanesulfonate monooxygenase SsuD/methylene tetrahydromethanopterin reductase-like flavin-dependent oxidoreductase (luciferase family)
MKVGVALNMLHEHGKPDAAVVHEHLAEGDLVEPLGFNSLWALEHHFTGYAMSPAPTQTLAYFAGRTKRVQLGTAVIVLPWHDPVRVAEQIALLDIMCGGRCLFGFGRGAASTEYEGFRIPMGEARPRFAEAAEVVVKALSQEVFEHHGEFFQIPSMSIRPRPISHPERRFYASSVSPNRRDHRQAGLRHALHHAERMEQVPRGHPEGSRSMSEAAGFAPKPPIILTNISCAESRQEAHERAHRYLGRKWQSIDDHYHFSDGHLASVKGYEAYGKTAKTYAKLKDPANLKKATDFYVSIQIVGTPDDCLQQLGRLQQLTGLDHLVAEFSWGNLPHHEAETNMRLFADRVLPTLQHDKAFATPKRTMDDAEATRHPAGEGIFAPA